MLVVPMADSVPHSPTLGQARFTGWLECTQWEGKRKQNPGSDAGIAATDAVPFPSYVLHGLAEISLDAEVSRA